MFFSKPKLCEGENEIPHFIRNDKKRMSLRGNEVAVAIPLLTIHKCLNETPHFTRGDNLIFGLKFMTDPTLRKKNYKKLLEDYIKKP